MIRIRLFEEKVSELKLKGLISGPVHTCIGQEAVSTGVCTALFREDYLIGNHRSHGHLLAKGTDVKNLMAEVLKGNGTSMHVKDNSIGVVCSTAIVGSGLSLACGVAFASKKVTCVFFGDGATSEGSFYESLNISAKWKLPVLFVLENNEVAVTTLINQVSTNGFLSNRAKPFGISCYIVDGQDVEQIYNLTKRATESMRKNPHPILIEALTYRFHEHQEGAVYERMIDTNYRSRKEVDYWIENRDPLELYSAKLIRNKTISKPGIKEIYSEESRLIDEAVKYALR